MTIFRFFFFHFCSDFFQSFFFHFICARNIDCGYKLKPRKYAQSIFQSKTTPPPKKKKKKKKKNNVYPCYCKPSFVHFFSFRCFIQGSDFPFFLLECIKASFYIYLSCKCVKLDGEINRIPFVTSLIS